MYILIVKTRQLNRDLYINYQQLICNIVFINYEGWNFNSGNYLFTTDTK